MNLGTYRANHDWIKRVDGVAMRLLAMEVVAHQAALHPLAIGPESLAWATNDAEMLLRMGYEPDEILLLSYCQPDGELTYRIHPVNALRLRGGGHA